MTSRRPETVRSGSNHWPDDPRGKDCDIACFREARAACTQANFGSNLFYPRLSGLSVAKFGFDHGWPGRRISGSGGIIRRLRWWKGRSAFRRGPSVFERLLVRHLERLPLGTPYTSVVPVVQSMVQDQELRGRCVLVMDGTGVGAPVVDARRVARLNCEVCAVTITGGDREHQHGAALECAEDGSDRRRAGVAGTR